MLIGPHGSWMAEDGSARSTVEVLGRGAGPEPAVGDDHDQGEADQQPVAAEWSLHAPPLQRGGPGAFLVDVDALLPAAAAFAVPLAVCAT
jgi:hypothetical protein